LKAQISSLEAVKKELEEKCLSMELVARENERLTETAAQFSKSAQEKENALVEKITSQELLLQERASKEEKNGIELAKLSSENMEIKVKLEQKISQLEAALLKNEEATKEKQTELDKMSKEKHILTEKCKKLEQLESENKALKMCCEHVERVEAEKKSLVEKFAQLEANQRNLELEETLQNTVWFLRMISFFISNFFFHVKCPKINLIFFFRSQGLRGKILCSLRKPDQWRKKLVGPSMIFKRQTLKRTSFY